MYYILYIIYHLMHHIGYQIIWLYCFILSHSIWVSVKGVMLVFSVDMSFSWNFSQTDKEEKPIRFTQMPNIWPDLRAFGLNNWLPWMKIAWGSEFLIQTIVWCLFLIPNPLFRPIVVFYITMLSNIISS